jgi:hypothetical protein
MAKYRVKSKPNLQKKVSFHKNNKKNKINKSKKKKKSEGVREATQGGAESNSQLGVHGVVGGCDEKTEGSILTHPFQIFSFFLYFFLSLRSVSSLSAFSHSQEHMNTGAVVAGVRRWHHRAGKP